VRRDPDLGEAVRVLSTGIAASLALLFTLQSPLTAQQSGRLEGQLVTRTEHTSGDAMAERPANGATIEATRMQPEPVLRFETAADERGRYRFDTLPPGEYALHVSTPQLDSLELAMADRSVAVVAGQRATADFIVPSGAALRNAVCPGLELGTGKGVVAGHATDAETERPLVGAIVVVGWDELVVDKATLRASNEERVANVVTGERGVFRLCGVPTGTSLMLQLQQGELASGVVTLAVSDDEGAVARDLSMSVGDSAVAQRPDSAMAARPDSVEHVSVRGLVAPPPPRATARATLVGIVRGVGGQPLVAAGLRIDGAPSTAVSDASGRYSLSNLPAGTQMLVVRHIGYEPASIAVELRPGRAMQRDVQLARVVSLDSIRVVAMRLKYPEFEFNRRANPFGRFLGPEEIARRKVHETSDLLTGIGGVMLVGHGPDAQANSVHGRRVGTGACVGMRVVLNGAFQGMALNDIAPSEVAAMEIYPQGEFAPTQYSIRGACGVIVIWTKSARRGGTGSGAMKRGATASQ
jgi:hypothetical protein